MVSSSIILGQSGSITADTFCNLGINTYVFAPAPASFTYQVYYPGGSYAQTYCNYPTSVGGLSTTCNTAYSYPPARRFCSCSMADCSGLSGNRRLLDEEANEVLQVELPAQEDAQEDAQEPTSSNISFKDEHIEEYHNARPVDAIPPATRPSEDSGDSQQSAKEDSAQVSSRQDAAPSTEQRADTPIHSMDSTAFTVSGIWTSPLAASQFTQLLSLTTAAYADPTTLLISALALIGMLVFVAYYFLLQRADPAPQQGSLAPKLKSIVVQKIRKGRSPRNASPLPPDPPGT
jgi:hypothetical protein